MCLFFKVCSNSHITYMPSLIFRYFNICIEPCSKPVKTYPLVLSTTVKPQSIVKFYWTIFSEGIGIYKIVEWIRTFSLIEKLKCLFKESFEYSKFIPIVGTISSVSIMPIFASDLFLIQILPRTDR